MTERQRSEIVRWLARQHTYLIDGWSDRTIAEEAWDVRAALKAEAKREREQYLQDVRAGKVYGCEYPAA